MALDLFSIYNNTPIYLQNVFCSIYGAKLFKERYSGKWKEYYNFLCRTQYLNPEEILNNQTIALKNILKHSINFVPYYKKNIDLKPNEIDSIKDIEFISELPIIEKKSIRESYKDFLSQKFNRSSLIRIGTSGTTGTPLTIYIAPDARKLNYAFFARSKKWAGIEGFERSITLAGRPIVPSSQNTPPFWRKNILFKNLLFSSYHISENNLKYYVSQIRKYKPVFIDSYPSSIYRIADYIIKNNIENIKLKAVITSAETLLEHQRDIIEKAFQCKVFDQYGSAEQVVFACQCSKGSYHINPEYGYLEVVDKNNCKVKNGEIGEFVCTGFTNFAMPFIRYKIGDKGIITNESCSCGNNFPIIKQIVGRNDDILITPDRKYIGRLDPIFKGVDSSIKETQIIQERLDYIVIKLVKTSNYKDKHGQFIINELQKRMGYNINFSIQYVNSIPLTKSGKFRAVICKID